MGDEMDRVIRLSLEVAGLRKRLVDMEKELSSAVLEAGRAAPPPSVEGEDSGPKRVMAALEAAGGEASVKVLAAATGLDSKAISSILSRAASRHGTVEGTKRGVYRLKKK